MGYSQISQSGSRAKSWQGGLEFRTLADTVSCPVFVIDGSGRCLFTSAQFQKLTGCSAGQLLGEGWFKFVHHDDRDQIATLWGRDTQIEGTAENSLRLRQSDGSFSLHRVTSRALPEPFSSTRLWIAACTPLVQLNIPSAQRQDVAAIADYSRLSENGMDPVKAILDALPFIIWKADEQGQIVGVNAAWWTTSGGPINDCPSFADLIVADVLGDFLAHWSFSTETGELLDILTELDDRLDGPTQARALALPVSDPNGVSKGVSWIGCFQVMSRTPPHDEVLALPKPITANLCQNHLPSVLVYLQDGAGDFGEPEVAHWHNGTWIAAGSAVSWPTHYLPIPKVMKHRNGNDV